MDFYSTMCGEASWRFFLSLFYCKFYLPHLNVARDFSSPLLAASAVAAVALIYNSLSLSRKGISSRKIHLGVDMSISACEAFFDDFLLTMQQGRSRESNFVTGSVQNFIYIRVTNSLHLLLRH
jgi:hypothetical protein